MGVINEAFHEILILARDGMDIREEGLSTTEYAGSLVAAEKVFGEIKKALKEGNVSLKNEKEAIGELLNDMRRNPNSSLDQFSEPEMSKSCEIQGTTQLELAPPDQDETCGSHESEFMG